MKKKEKVTRELLRRMQIGETKTVYLSNAQACDTGKSIAYQMQNILNCRFTIETDYKNNILTITKSQGI